MAVWGGGKEGEAQLCYMAAPKKDESDPVPPLQEPPHGQEGEHDKRHAVAKATHGPAASEEVREGFLEEGDVGAGL